MAGSRTEKIGTIFSRVHGLLKSGAMKEVDKPIWYDVYAAFPPLVEPKYERFQEEREPRNILYKEDVIRARFYKTFGSPDVINMRDPHSVPLSERFISMYNDMAKSGVEETSIFDKVVEVLQAEGIKLKTVEEIEREKKLRALKVRLENEKNAKAKQQQAKSEGGSLDIEDLFKASAGSSSEEPDHVPEDDYSQK